MNSFIVKSHHFRAAIVHYHIMKTGGSTICSILEREFGPTYAEVHGPDAGSALLAPEIVEFLRNHPRIQAVSSHHFRFPQVEADDMHIADCCFLRHPLDRLYSLYLFFKGTRDASEVGYLAQRYEAPRFFDELMREFPSYVCNVQTNFLACSGLFKRLPGKEDLAAAARTIRNCAIPGTVSSFDESLTVAEYVLHPVHSTLQLHYTAQNVRRSASSLREVEYELRHLCGSRVYNRLMRMNDLDLQLLCITEEEIHRRSEQIPGFEDRLTQFRDRCGVRPVAAKPNNIVPVEIRIAAFDAAHQTARSLRALAAKPRTGTATEAKAPRTWLPFGSNPLSARLFNTLGIVTVIAAVDRAGDVLWGSSAIVTLSVAVALCTAAFGWLEGIAAGLLASLISDYLFIPPVHRLTLDREVIRVAALYGVVTGSTWFAVKSRVPTRIGPR